MWTQVTLGKTNWTSSPPASHIARHHYISSLLAKIPKKVGIHGAKDDASRTRPYDCDCGRAWNLDFCKIVNFFVWVHGEKFLSHHFRRLFFFLVLASDSKKTTHVLLTSWFYWWNACSQNMILNELIAFWAKASSVQSLRIRGWPNGRFAQPKATKNIQKGILCWGIQGGYTSFYVLDSIQQNIETWNIVKHSNYKIGTFCLIGILIHSTSISLTSKNTIYHFQDLFTLQTPLPPIPKPQLHSDQHLPYIPSATTKKKGSGHQLAWKAGWTKPMGSCRDVNVFTPRE